MLIMEHPGHTRIADIAMGLEKSGSIREERNLLGVKETASSTLASLIVSNDVEAPYGRTVDSDDEM